MSFKKLDVSSPGAIITLVVLAFIAVKLAVLMIPMLTEALVDLGGIDNFTFAPLFQSGGLVAIVVSAMFLIGILALFGIATGGKKR